MTNDTTAPKQSSGIYVASKVAHADNPELTSHLYGDGQPKPLRDFSLSLYGTWEAGDKRHPQHIMTALGIVRTYDVPQSIMDAWWFLGCSNVPADLPPFITEMVDFDPMKSIGWGLSREMAENLIAQRKVRSP